ncbi:MAG: IPT/TIG domain-containing protein, partial [Blastocatellia bacterium]
TVRAIAGGGLDFLGDNVPGSQADLGEVTGLAVSANGALVYLANQLDGLVRAVNVSAGAATVGANSIGSGRVGTLVTSVGSLFNGLSIHPTTGDLYVVDSATGVNKVFKISSGGTMTAVAGNGANTTAEASFSPGPATGVPLLLPRAIEFDASGNLFIADTGHGRVIRVDGGGAATLVHQFQILNNSGLNRNPYPSGIAVVGGNVYVTNGNQQSVWRVTGGAARIAGTVTVQNGATIGQPCDYSGSNCGDDGAAVNAGFKFLVSTDNPPLAGVEGDQNNGLFILDQTGKGRVRYINLSGGAVTVAGLSVAAGAIRTIAGNGLEPPYDGGPATGASFNAPTGVAVDGAGNLWVSDTNSGLLRFVNRGGSQVTIFAGTAAAQTVPAGAVVTVNKDADSGGGDSVNQAAFVAPQGLFATSQGVYVADSNGGPKIPPETINGRDTSLIRFINTTSAAVTIFPGAGANAITVPPGNVRTIAGGGADDLSSGFATTVTFKGASDVVVAGNGAIYVTDVGKKAVRKIDGSTGTVSELALTAGKEYTGLGLDSSGRLLIANFTDGVVLRESSAGSGSFANFATGLGKPRDVAGAPDGGAYVTDGAASSISGNHRIVRISSSGATSVIAGGSSPGFGGDGGAATGSQINISPPRLVLGFNPLLDVPETVNIVVGQSGEVIFTDTNNNRVRRISAAAVTCVQTRTITISGLNPAPVLTSLNPNNRLVNSGEFTLTAIGSNFAPSSIIRWNGQNRVTKFASATELSATIPASDLATAGTAQVRVFTPAPGGGTSGAAQFTIVPLNPVPTITSLSPSSAVEGSQGFTLTVNGTGFINNVSVVRWDGSPRLTTFVNATRLTAQIDASDIVGIGQASVTVFNPAPGGGVSNASAFNITQATGPV